MIRLFWATLSFMSRLPVPQRWSRGVEIDQYVRGIVTFPVIGLLLGGLSGLVFLFIQPGGGIPVAAFACVLALALLTGGLHLDGLADTCDGVFSARSRERMLEIMRDSRLGTHGGLALIFVLLGKVLVISELAVRGNAMLPVLACACIAGRSAVVMMMYRQRYAREQGMGNLFIGKLSAQQVLTTLILGLVLCFAGLHLRGVLAMLATIVLVWVLGCALKRTLGGQTGDTLGAAIELGELVFLLALL
ncbi:adenosylcobinamide-GDP ribazoletransferase [Shimwellia blattae]|uniref:Adenosylcobinamide-GDP ribazoletransferase n=2 Tax=Shimwellia blattae TaxID=563 RepID=I2B7U2_SHIBC|nr:adenosylcobinamide-GDP ribazoletransferase [Shimwellia blattae]AAW83002.1 cobalamin 5'-phosphate synthase [Shimwellia blattae]AFJ46596.1 cobalamin 5'-phosphate synthase CobS [Shimwellia blattae DSM 4481 = NBRC 105725]VDY64067.1 cobalamin synthase [Shimwellia blattae]VEC22200.1 cobalamin synthase [Shimwellia blattae]GAB80176.1 cobalamin synthase [Shimwellia blattae DSM 4481 = NBRC 105725]